MSSKTERINTSGPLSVNWCQLVGGCPLNTGYGDCGIRQHLRSFPTLSSRQQEADYLARLIEDGKKEELVRICQQSLYGR